MTMEKSQKNPLVIQLPNRYGDKNYLEEIEPNLFKVIFESPDYIRIGFEKDNSVAFIDPPGGPMLFVGSEYIPGKIITEILGTKKNFFLIMEDKSSN